MTRNRFVFGAKCSGEGTKNWDKAVFRKSMEWCIWYTFVSDVYIIMTDVGDGLAHDDDNSILRRDVCVRTRMITFTRGNIVLIVSPHHAVVSGVL